MKQYTDITVLLDRSGSMELIKPAMEEAFNTFIQEHKKVPSTRISLVQFDGSLDYDVVYQNVPITVAEKLTLYPRGSTPLLDAFCKTIDATGARLRNMPETERPDQVLMVVITDGQENSSKEFKREDVKSRVTRQQNDYNWQFVYLGANQDSFAEAASFGIQPQRVLNYAATMQGVRGASAALAHNTVIYTSNDIRGVAVPDWTDTQRKQAEGK